MSKTSYRAINNALSNVSDEMVLFQDDLVEDSIIVVDFMPKLRRKFEKSVRNSNNVQDLTNVLQGKVILKNWLVLLRNFYRNDANMGRHIGRFSLF
jgi:hypothetical protein